MRMAAAATVDVAVEEEDADERRRPVQLVAAVPSVLL